jgi:hypothetical protein
VTGSPDERRGTSPRQVLFRNAVDQLLALAEALPENPAQTDLEPIRKLALSACERCQGDPELEHRARNILTVTTLSSQFASAVEAVQWIKEAVRGTTRD